MSVRSSATGRSFREPELGKNAVLGGDSLPYRLGRQRSAVPKILKCASTPVRRERNVADLGEFRIVAESGTFVSEISSCEG